MSEEFEGDSPLLAIAVERGGVLVDAHDQADTVLEVLVDEGNAVADAEVGTTWDLRWRVWLVIWCELKCRVRTPAVRGRRHGCPFSEAIRTSSCSAASTAIGS